MTAQRRDLTIEQGGDFLHEFPVTAADGTPFDISGYQAALQVRPFVGAPYTLLTLSTANGGLVLGTGWVQAAVPEAVTANLLPGAYVYDLKMLSPTGFASRWYQGACFVSPEVTTFDFAAPSPGLAPYTDAAGDPYTDAAGTPYTP
ncbi:hypothetical protein R5W24_000463 [Gemmata sp. JC717]|uniref:hypothetical protein n=1 Tax=Gemmata algarum TaxID=2975278 RepID=UPI0021BB1152|nr:hypothetical protein [Gemmata algarum]MDY3551387.1 hypothetical protein [Gemmata algarum]